MEKQMVRSIRIAMLLIKAGYAVRIGRRVVPGQGDKKKAQMEYTVEFWEEDDV